jgi:hypothetical protein
VEIVYHLRRLVVVGDGCVVSSIADVEEDDGITLSDVVLECPSDGVRTLVGEVDCYADFAVGGWRRCRGRTEGESKFKCCILNS